MKKSFYLSLAVLCSLMISCNGVDNEITNPQISNDEELITAVILTLKDSSNTENVKEFTFKDSDGEGGNDPEQFDTIRLDSGVVYNCSIILLNDSDTSDVEDISQEVLEEADEHLFCFESNEVNISLTDSDGVYPIGLESQWQAITKTQEGTVTVTLKHQPEGVKNGDCSVGETDVELTFILEIN